MLYDFGNEFTSSDGQKFAWEDGDTLVDNKGSKYRIKGFDTAEVEHEKGAPSKAPGTTYGMAQTAAIADIVKNRGFNNVEFGEKDVYGRTLINLSDNNGNPLENTLHYEGIVDNRAAMTTEQQAARESGDLFRRMNPEYKNKYYDSARSMLDQSKTEDFVYHKVAAPDEWSYRHTEGGIDGAPRLDALHAPYIKRGDRNIMNEADSTLFSSIGAGVDSMQAGLYGLAQATGNRASIQALEDFGTKGKFLNTDAVDFDRPYWVRSYKQINTDDWGKGLEDGVDWAVGLFGTSLPYILPYVFPLTRGVAPLGLGAVFAGQVWNDMEGPLEERSFSTALIAGISMAMIDKLAANKLTTIGLTASSFTGRESLQKAVQTLAKNNDLSKEQANKILRETQLDTMVETFSDIVTKMGKPDLMDAIKLSKATYLKGISSKAGTGFGTESITEGLQETIQYGAAVAGSDKKWNTGDYTDTMINALLGGGLLGSGFGVAGGIISNPQELRGLRNKYKDAGMYESELVDGKETLDAVPVSDSYVIRNEDGSTTKKSIFQDKIVTWLDQALFDRNKNGLVNRTWGDLLDRRFYRTNTEINKERIGPETWKASPVTRSLSEMYGWLQNRTTTGSTYEQDRRRLVSKLTNGVGSIQKQARDLFGIKKSLADKVGIKVGGKASAKAYSKLMEYARYKADVKTAERTKRKAPKSNELYANPTFRAKADEMLEALSNDQGTGLIDRIEAIKADLDPSYRPHASKSRYDTTALSQFKVKQKRQDFIHRLMDKKGLTREEAITEANRQSDTPVGYKADQYDATTPQEKSPVGAARKPKSTNKKIDYLKNDDFKDFFVEDGFAALMQDGVETANWANDLDHLGAKGEKIYSQLNAAMEEHGDPEFVRGILDNITALRGTLNKIESEKLRKIQTVIGTVQMYAYLPFAALASIPELAVTYLGLDNIDAVTKHTKESGKQLARQLLPFMKDRSESIFGNADEVRKFERANAILYNEGHLRMDHSAIGMVDVDSDIINMSKRMRNISDAYFKLILLKPFTDYTRLLRAASGQDFVMEKLNIVNAIDLNAPLKQYQRDAISMLQELGVDPIEMAKNHSDIVKNFAEKEIDTLDFDKIVSHLENSKKLKNDVNAQRLLNQYATAVTNFVDAGIVNPDPTKKPLFYSDDRFRLLFQFQGFMSVFTTTVLRKMWKDVAKGNPAAQYSAFAMLTTMMMLGFASQAMRDELKYQGTPAWLTDSKKVQRAVGASGVLGQGERLLNLFFPLWKQDENLLEKGYGELGPAARTAANLQLGLGNLAEGDIDMAANQALKLVPGLGVSTTSRQAVAEKIGNFFE